ncbi:protein of unknown function [Gracilibacillus ureilyticus]|uniref:DUF4179 domain-containing protein n=1 Tax=Gracilibacillus ureilyticus TaxID=531814 RepID=A0A1H9UA37_9BACI|nr:DUF4179 domain-containing protein [Gracilibacillus ureilyticus]SES05953.1 protein of unknown function [Gracilibacillus ureilyticus]
MSSAKQHIRQKKDQLQKTHAPAELEDRLRERLNKQPTRRPKRNGIILRSVAALIIVSLLIGYNYQSLAYYGKKIIGYDHITSDTLQHLNDLGMGQVVNKSITFEDGVRFTIDGVIVDDNQLVMFYTMESPQSIEEHPELDHQPTRITGFLTDSNHESGVGEISEDGKVMKGTHSFEPPNGFAKELTVEFFFTSDTLTFSYDPSKAMGHSIKQPINEKITLDDGHLTFKTITASPTLTRITGSGNKALIENIDFEQMRLLVNGEEISQFGTGYSTGITGTTFEMKFDALPTDYEELAIELHLPNDQVIEIYSE